MDQYDPAREAAVERAQRARVTGEHCRVSADSNYEKFNYRWLARPHNEPSLGGERQPAPAAAIPGQQVRGNPPADRGVSIGGAIRRLCARLLCAATPSAGSAAEQCGVSNRRGTTFLGLHRR
jgi:hypothetical protein